MMTGIACTGQNPSNFYYCGSLSDISLDVDDQCIEADQQCDGTRDCPFGDDEWNCNTFGDNDEECTEANGYFECVSSPSADYTASNSSDNVCIRFEFSCDDGEFETWDCPNQEDLAPATCDDDLRCMLTNIYVCLFVFFYVSIFYLCFFFVSSYNVCKQHKISSKQRVTL